MRRKILILSIVAILIAMLVILTGCGNETKQLNSSQEATGDVTTENNSENKNNGIDVLEMYATSSQYAVVLGNDTNYYIINKNGKIEGQLNVSSLSDSSGVKITNEGNVLINIENEGTKIYDKNGNVIFEKTSNETYSTLTDYNYTIKKSKTSDFESGSTWTSEIVDLKGQTIKKLNNGDSYTYLGGHIWVVSDNEGYKLYNDKTDKSVNYANAYNLSNETSYNVNKSDDKSYCLSGGGVYYKKSAIILEDLTVIDRESNSMDFSNVIVVDENYYYNKEDKTIYKWDGTKVKEVSSGDGLLNIEYIDGKYFVRSGTGYYYTMDDNFESTSEPFKIESEKNLRALAMAKNSIIVEEQVSMNQGGYSGTWDHVYVYDYSGNLKEDLGEGWDATSDGSSDFIYRVKTMTSRELNERSNTYSTKNVGNQTGDKFINKTTGEILKIYK